MRVLAFLEGTSFNAKGMSDVRAIVYVKTKECRLLSLSFLQDDWYSLRRALPKTDDVDMFIELDVESSDIETCIKSYRNGECFSEDVDENTDIYRIVTDAATSTVSTVEFIIPTVSQDMVVGIYSIIKKARGIDKIHPEYHNDSLHPMLHTDMFISHREGQVIKNGRSFITLSNEGRRTFREWYGMNWFQHGMFYEQLIDSCNLRTFKQIEHLQGSDRFKKM